MMKSITKRTFLVLVIAVSHIASGFVCSTRRPNNPKAILMLGRHGRSSSSSDKRGGTRKQRGSTAVATFTIAALLVVAPMVPVQPVFAEQLTKADVQDIVSSLNNKLEAKLEAKFEEQKNSMNKLEAKFEEQKNSMNNLEASMNNKFDEQRNMFAVVPVVSAGIVGAANIYSSNKLERAINQFKKQENTIKKDLNAGVEQKAFVAGQRGAFTAALAVLFVMMASISTNN